MTPIPHKDQPGRALPTWMLRAAAVIPLVSGSIMFTGWLLGYAQRWTTTITSSKTNMALGHILGALTLLLLSGTPSVRRRGAAFVTAALVFLIGALTLSEHVFGWNLHIDQLFASEAPGMWGTTSPNRMGPPGAASLTLLGSAFLLILAGRRRMAPYLGLIVCLIMLVPAIGYLYGIREFYSDARVTGIGWPSVVSLFCLGMGTILLQPESGMIAPLLREDAGARLLRGLLPTAILAPVLLGFLRTFAENREWLVGQTGRGTLVISMIVVMSALVYRSAGRLSRADRERRIAEEDLRIEEERYRLAIQATNDATWDVNFTTGEIHRNEKYRDLFGEHSPGEDSWQWWVSRIHPDDRECASAGLKGAVESTSAYWACEYRFRRVNGEWADVFDRAFISRDAEGKATRVVGAMLDQTQRKLAEQELRTARLEAERASAAKDHFLAVLSHELRTPLTPAMATAQALEHDPSLTTGAREAAGLIRRNIELEARLIDDLLDLTRISRGKLTLQVQQLDLHEQVRSAVQTCSEEASRKQLSVYVKLEAAARFIQGDPARVQQIIWNVLRNAVKFTPVAGEVFVESENRGDETIAITIRDTGVGITVDSLDRIFRPFEQGSTQTARLFGGLGLGLSISRALVELHGGKISARSDGSGHGAVFSIEFPVSKVVQPATPANSPQPIVEVARSCRVLLVEDHADTSKVMSSLMRRWGYDVTTASTVAEAIEAARSRAFHLLISDLGLPDGTGYDVMRHIAPISPIPGIALSGYGQPEDLARTKAAGFSEHLVKPVDIGVLRQSLARLTRPQDTPA